MTSSLRLTNRRSLQIGSNVLGVVTACHLEHFSLHVGSHTFGYLPRKAITDLEEKSQVHLGAVIHAVVIHVNPLGHVVLGCPNVNRREQIYGILKGGVGVTTYRSKHRSKLWWKLQIKKHRIDGLHITAGSNSLVCMESSNTRNLANVCKALRSSS